MDPATSGIDLFRIDFHEVSKLKLRGLDRAVQRCMREKLFLRSLVLRNDRAAITRAVTATMLVGFASSCGETSDKRLRDALGGGASPTDSANVDSDDSTGGGGPGSGNHPGGVANGSDGGEGEGASPAKALFDALYPTLDAQCGNACHRDGNAGAPGWLALPDPYASIRKYPSAVVKDPTSSALLTKGPHTGPSLNDPLRSDVLRWLTAEASGLAATEEIATAPFALATGTNSVDLSSLGAGLAGTKLTFTAAMSGAILNVTALKITSPAAAGLHIVFPMFVVVDSAGKETPDYSFSNLDQTVAAGANVALGPGVLILSNWIAGGKLKLSFRKLEATAVVDGGATGGCKALASFTQNAVPAIQNNQCLNCHTAGTAQQALDLSGLRANPRDDARACAQARNRINTATPAQSQIILAPRGQVPNHPFAQASDAYVTSMTAWITAER